MRVLFIVDGVLPVTNAAAVRIGSFMRQLPWPRSEVLGGSPVTAAEGCPGMHLVTREDAPRSWAFVRSWLSYLVRMYIQMVRLAVRFDAVVVSVPKYELLFAAPLIRWRAGLLVIDVRDTIDFVDYTDHFRQFLPDKLAKPLGVLTRAFGRRVLDRCLSSADLITVANVGIRDSLPKWQSKIEVIANGVDVEQFVPLRSRSRKNSDLLEMVYLGNFAGKDRFEWLYEGIPDLKGRVRINLIGNGRRKEEVCLKLEELRIDYKDYGLMHHSEIPAVLDTMHVAFLFRDAYADASIPVSFFEFAAMNIPVICNSVGISDTFVRRFACGIVVDSPSQFVATVRNFLDQPDLLGGYQSLHELATREFSRDVQAKRFIECLSSAMCAPALRARGRA